MSELCYRASVGFHTLSHRRAAMASHAELSTNIQSRGRKRGRSRPASSMPDESDDDDVNITDQWISTNLVFLSIKTCKLCLHSSCLIRFGHCHHCCRCRLQCVAAVLRQACDAPHGPWGYVFRLTCSFNASMSFAWLSGSNELNPFIGGPRARSKASPCWPWLAGTSVKAVGHICWACDYTSKVGNYCLASLSPLLLFVLRTLYIFGGVLGLSL
jgi:hypothetical protein